MTIEEFIEVRIAEDEQQAREATDDGHNWLVEEESISLWPDDREPLDGFMGFPRKAHARHAARQDPRSTLNRCDALREIMRNIEALYFLDPNAARLMTHWVASIWRHHPDYRQDWPL